MFLSQGPIVNKDIKDNNKRLIVDQLWSENSLFKKASNTVKIVMGVYVHVLKYHVAGDC